MAETQRDREVYRLQYEAARALFEDDLKGCISAAKQNLGDPSLPPYYVIINCILVAGALEDWRDADIFRLTAEDVYHENFAKATTDNDEGSLELLKGLAKKLKELNEYRDEDLLALEGIAFVSVWDDGTDEIGGTEEYQEGIVAMDDEMDVPFPDGYSDVSEDDARENIFDAAAGDGVAKNVELPSSD